MKFFCQSVCLPVVLLAVVSSYAGAAETGRVNLVNPIVPQSVVEAGLDDTGRHCGEGLLLQKSGHCCPTGTNNEVWPNICTPHGTIDDQIFNFRNEARYCPSPDMLIVSDKDRNWFSCADSSSVPMYSAAKKFEGSTFCSSHGYGSLIRIRPWGTVGCIKIGDSQGDGCIEAGTCSFVAR